LLFLDVDRIRIRIAGSDDLPKDRPNLLKVLIIGLSDLHASVWGGSKSDSLQQFGRTAANLGIYDGQARFRGNVVLNCLLLQRAAVQPATPKTSENGQEQTVKDIHYPNWTESERPRSLA